MLTRDLYPTFASPLYMSQEWGVQESEVTRHGLPESECSGWNPRPGLSRQERPLQVVTLAVFSLPPSRSIAGYVCFVFWRLHEPRRLPEFWPFYWPFPRKHNWEGGVFPVKRIHGSGEGLELGTPGSDLCPLICLWC